MDPSGHSWLWSANLLWTIGLMSRVFANGPGDRGSIPGRVIPKTQKVVLDGTLSIIRYGSRVKWSNPENGVAPFPTPWCSSYWKESLQVTLDCIHQLYFIYIDIYIYIYKTVFNPVNPDLGTIPSRTNKIFENRISNLSNPSQELNVNKIHRANNFLLKKSAIGHIKIISLFPSC